MLHFINKFLVFVILIMIILIGYKSFKQVNSVTIPIDHKVSSTAVTNVILKDYVENIVKEYIDVNAETILEKIKNQSSKSLVNKSYDSKNIQYKDFPFIGNKNCDVLMMFFYDYGCLYCKRSNEYLNQLIKTDNGVGLVLLPLSILEGNSIYAAKVCLSTFLYAPDKFNIVHQGLIELHEITEESVKDMLKKHSINIQILDYVNNPAVKALLDKNFILANSLNIKGVPAYVINGKILPGFSNFEQIYQEVLQARQNISN